MERREEMIDSLAELIVEMTERRKILLKEYGQTEKKSLIMKINKIRELTHKREGTILVITWLRSSYITSSHLFRMAIYEEEPFIEVHPIDDYYDMSSFFDDLLDDLKLLEGNLSKVYDRILKSEMEEIRRYYLEQCYQNCVGFFEEAVNSIEIVGEDKPTKVFFGEEMGIIRLVGMI